MDASGARIVLLVAPAGYGKTTLIRQWVSDGKRRARWFRANPSSADVAALAIDLAQAVAGVVTADVEEAIRRHLRSTSSPSKHAEALGRTMAQALSEWPLDTWLVVDDYDYLATSGPAERFIEVILENSPIQVVTASRRRPHWGSARRVVYGEICEVLQGDLAFTQSETGEVLAERRDEAVGIWMRTKGWPAVIRLAALTGNLSFPEEALPPALHQYFAEELFQAASCNIQDGLVRLAALPTLSPALIALALTEETEAVCEEGIALGFLSNDGEIGLELHPLLRTFLDRKLRDGDREFLRCLTIGVIGKKSWDDAFTMIERFGQIELLPELFEAALDPLLEQRRFATLEAWVAFATRHGCSFSCLLLAEAEISRRLGRFGSGEARALQAGAALAETRDSRTSRAYALAGECAHHDYRPTDALSNHRLAEQHALTDVDTRRAIWGQFVAATHTETDNLRNLLDRFEAVADIDPATKLRVACGRMMLATVDDGLETVLNDQERLTYLVDRTDDRLVTTSFLYRVAYMNAATARYAKGLEVATWGQAEALRASLPFAEGHMGAALAASTLGLRQFRRTHLLVSRLFDVAAELDDRFELANAQALLAKTRIAEQMPSDAAEALKGWERAPTAAIRGECAALRAVALAASNRHAEALELAGHTLAMTRDVQPITLARSAEAISALDTNDSHADDALVNLEDVLLKRQNYDNLVCAYRAYPPLLAALRDRGRLAITRLEDLVREARDYRIVASLNWDLEPPARRSALLSPRERQVYDLVCKGLTNREIASQLVIAEVTAKVHVRHILAKLGARSRTEAALQLYEPA